MKKIFILTVSIKAMLLASFSGTIIDKNTNKPIHNVIISDSNHSVRSDVDGSFHIDSKEDTYYVKA